MTLNFEWQLSWTGTYYQELRFENEEEEAGRINKDRWLNLYTFPDRILFDNNPDEWHDKYRKISEENLNHPHLKKWSGGLFTKGAPPRKNKRRPRNSSIWWRWRLEIACSLFAKKKCSRSRTVALSQGLIESGNPLVRLKQLREDKLRGEGLCSVMR